MNVNELYILNRSLDGQEIPFVKYQDTLGIRGVMIDIVKDGMISKGILRNYYEFSEYGIKITNRLRRYKNAKKHIKINHLAIGIVSESESILLFWNPLLKEYSMDEISGGLDGEEIAHGLGLLEKNTTNSLDNAELFSSQEWNMGLSQLKSNRIKLLVAEGKLYREEIYFFANEQSCVFDCLSNISYPMSQENIIIKFNERMRVV